MAQAILLQEVEGLGTVGDAVEVSAGYLRNFLVPRKLAQPATKAALEQAIQRREQAERDEREANARAGETASLLSRTVLTINHRAGEDGKLYGSVGAKEIVTAIAAARGLRVDQKKVMLSEPIREIGTFLVDIDVGGGSVAQVKTIIAEEK